MARIVPIPGLISIAAAILPAALLPAPVRAEILVTSLSTHRVLIGSNYTGSEIAVFGSVEREGRTVSRADPYDLVVTVIGPRRHLLVRQKERRGLFWLNNEQRRFVEAPSFLATMTTRPISEMGSEEDARRLQIGLKNRLTPPGAAMSLDPGEARFTEALIRLKSEDDLYQQTERGVTFLTPSLFRAAVTLPATAPTGNYDVLIELYAGGVSLARQETSFEVVQIGFEQQVAWVARNWSLFYGTATALTALLFGWIATMIFRRD